MIRLMGLALFPSLCLMAGPGHRSAAADLHAAAGCRPTRLDYVVLASLADAPNWMNLSAYRGPAGSGRGVGGN